MTRDRIRHASFVIGTVLLGGLFFGETVHVRSDDPQPGKTGKAARAIRPRSTGKAFPIFERRSIGTIMQVTPRIVSENNLMLELTVRDDRIVVPPTPFVLGQGTDGPIIAPELVTSNFTGKLIVKSGHAVAVQGLQNNSKEKKGRVLAIVMARIENAADAK